MLSPLQQKAVWEGWIGAETRALYFAELSRHYLVGQRALAWSTLAASSGAMASLLAEGPPMVRLGLAATTAALSLWSALAHYSKSATDSADLYLRWAKLAGDYEALWDDMYSEEAPRRLAALRQIDLEVSKSGTVLPNRPRAMLKWERRVVAQHGLTLAS